MRTDVDLQLLLIFSMVAEHSSFSKAATMLGVAKGTVSRSVSQLESLLGLELLHRTTHHVALSTAGRALYERTRAHLVALRGAVLDLPECDEEPAGLLRITAPLDFGNIILPAILAAFVRRYPSVRFDVLLSSAQIDLVKDGYDCAIRASSGRLKDSSLTSRRIGGSTAKFYASPSYVARRGRPKSLDDPKHSWILHPGVIRRLKLEHVPYQFIFDDFGAIRELVRQGAGVGLLPSFVARGDARDGLIEEIPIDGLEVQTGEFVLLYPSSGQTARKLVAFRDFLVEFLRKEASLMG